MARRFCPLLLLFSFLFPHALGAQQEQLSSIAGQLRVLRGDFPSHRILIELRYRGSAINSAYADSDGKFGFSNLVGGEYHIIINDEEYYPVDERLILNPDISTVVLALLTLRPREDILKNDPAGARPAGSNAYLVNPADYNKRFPKKAIKEYEKGLDADHRDRREEAIAHYEDALKIAPDFYPAHNNLGSDYLSKSDFVVARKEFEEAIRLNQSDAAAYLNLSNVCMLTDQLADAQKFLDEGMRRQPDSALAHFLLGSLDMRIGKLQEAEVALHQAIQLSPVMAQARLQLVNLLLQQGRRTDAVAQLHEFVSAFPDSPFSAQAKQLLQRLEPSAKTSAIPH
jgi:Flp pilus assembly protein TadD